MKTGLLWYDDSGKELEEKVAGAARRYEKKHGWLPDACYVHPSALSGKKDANGDEAKTLPVTVNGAEVTVAVLPSILRHHFWLGMEKASASGR